MTVLSALDSYYKRLQDDGAIPSPGYSRESISHVIVLNTAGEVMAVEPHQNDKGRAKKMVVPAAFKRPGKVCKPFFLWDKASYLLGVIKPDPKNPATSETDARRAAEVLFPGFQELHENRLSKAQDPGLQALQKFISNWRPEHFATPPFAEEHRDGVFAFRLDGRHEFLHECAEARSMVADSGEEEGGQQVTCLISGRTEQPLALVDPAIKGVQNAQAVGANIVSFDKSAFESYGKKQGGNAPVSKEAAFTYTTALNHLLRKETDNRQRLEIGDATVVYWAEAADSRMAARAEELFSDMVDPPSDEQENAKIRDVLHTMKDGRPLSDVDPKLNGDTRFYVLGLAPSAARISIRFWLQSSLDELGRRFVEHYQDRELQPPPRTAMPSICRLLNETALKSKGDVPFRPYKNLSPVLAGEVMRAILSGGRYPRSLLNSTLVRLRADRDVTGLKAAIIKACLSRDYRLSIEKEDLPVSLDREEKNPGYLLGRLFSLLENAQRKAIPGVNASIRDRYYGSASATPATVFPTLMRNLGNHLSKIRKSGNEGLAHWLDSEVGGVIDGFQSATFPRHLDLQDQGRFAVGYYHQSHYRKDKSSDKE